MKTTTRDPKRCLNGVDGRVQGQKELNKVDVGCVLRGRGGYDCCRRVDLRNQLQFNLAVGRSHHRDLNVVVLIACSQIHTRLFSGIRSQAGEWVQKARLRREWCRRSRGMKTELKRLLLRVTGAKCGARRGRIECEHSGRTASGHRIGIEQGFVIVDEVGHQTCEAKPQ